MICRIGLLEVYFCRQLELGNSFFDQLEPIFLGNFYAYTLLLSLKQLLLSIGASQVGKTGLSVALETCDTFFSKGKLKKSSNIQFPVMGIDYQLRRTMIFIFYFFLKVGPSGRLILIKNLYWNRFFV